MIYEIEVLTLVFAIGIFLFVVSNRRTLRQMPQSGLFLAGFATLFPGWIAALFDQNRYGGIISVVEHIAYATALLILALWTTRVFNRKGERPA